MDLEILDKIKIQNHLDKTHLIAYSDSFARFAKSAYGSQRSFIGVKERNELKAIFPIFEREYRRQKVAEVPLFIYTEIFLVDENFTIDADVLGKELLKFSKADVVRFNLYHFSHQQVKTNDANHVFTAMAADLSRVNSYDAYLNKVLSKNARSKIYKAYQGGFDLAWLTPRDLPLFHRPYSDHVKQLGSKPHPQEHFKKMFAAHQPGKDLSMMGAQKDGRLITANLFVVNGDYMEVRFLADDLDYRRLFPNNFLYAEMIKWAYANNLRVIDFGGIPKAMRTNIEFKKSLGAKEFPIYTKYFFRNHWQMLLFKIGKKMLYWKKYRRLMIKKYLKI